MPLRICLIFRNFQSGNAYKKVPICKSVNDQLDFDNFTLQTRIRCWLKRLRSKPKCPSDLNFTKKETPHKYQILVNYWLIKEDFRKLRTFFKNYFITEIFL